MKPREFWMDTDLLDSAIRFCDLGDGYMAKVRMYPHKDYIHKLTLVREVTAEEPEMRDDYDFSDGKPNPYTAEERRDALEELHSSRKAIDEATKLFTVLLTWQNILAQKDIKRWLDKWGDKSQLPNESDKR
jgi:hypothetical protein